MSRYTDAFDRVCGNCSGVDIMSITADDVKNQFRIWQETGEATDVEELDNAIIGLSEYQSLK